MLDVFFSKMGFWIQWTPNPPDFNHWRSHTRRFPESWGTPNSNHVSCGFSMKSTNQLGLPIDGGRWKPPYPEIDTTGSPSGKKLGETVHSNRQIQHRNNHHHYYYCNVPGYHNSITIITIILIAYYYFQSNCNNNDNDNSDNSDNSDSDNNNPNLKNRMCSSVATLGDYEGQNHFHEKKLHIHRVFSSVSAESTR